MVLVYGLTFALLLALWDFFSGRELDAMKLIIMALFFGGFMTWNSVKRMRRLKEQTGDSVLTSEDFNAAQQIVVSSSKSIHEIYNSLRTDAATEKWKLSLEGQHISGTTRTSVFIFGEKINVTANDGEVLIESCPVLPTVFFDNGKNKQNVLFLKYIVEC